MKRTARLFALTEVLRGRRTGITADALAERFGVSTRTMMRDLDALRSASVPINTERGRGGGIHLDKSYTMPPIGLTAREALMLVAMLKFAKELRIMPLTDALDSAADKVRAALPKATQQQLSRLETSLRFVGVPARDSDHNVRRVIEHAWFEGTDVDIVYAKPNGTETARRIRMDTIILERGETLLNCIDVHSGDSRQFRLHRITSARLVPREL